MPETQCSPVPGIFANPTDSVQQFTTLSLRCSAFVGIVHFLLCWIHFTAGSLPFAVFAILETPHKRG